MKNHLLPTWFFRLVSSFTRFGVATPALWASLDVAGGQEALATHTCAYNDCDLPRNLKAARLHLPSGEPVRMNPGISAVGRAERAGTVHEDALLRLKSLLAGGAALHQVPEPYRSSVILRSLFLRRRSDAKYALPRHFLWRTTWSAGDLLGLRGTVVGNLLRLLIRSVIARRFCVSLGFVDGKLLALPGYESIFRWHGNNADLSAAGRPIHVEAVALRTHTSSSIGVGQDDTGGPESRGGGVVGAC